ncbi:spermine oxidase-like [Trichogramma pretiosum]|uniref:spermine oxidase-like n=1 Tax=Trichogramma pretiosum TaxID=7493 RepID=UPI0006C98AB2|nr:spermine oxidase-like [Trichogramma pretiosum]
MARCSGSSISKAVALCLFLAVLVEAYKLPSDAKKNAKIVVIGAGASGIAAASKLFENGFSNVTVLEAEDRIGGRVYTARFANYSVDLGGQWVHGQDGNVAYGLANPLGLLDASDRPDFGFKQKLVDSQGEPIDDAVAEKLWLFFMENLHDVEFHNDTTYESIGQYADKVFDEKFQNDPEILKNKSKYSHLLESMRLSADPADCWLELSALGSQVYKEYPGDQVVNWKTRGYSTILDILMKAFPNPEQELPVRNNTILSTEVTSINYSNLKDDLPILITTKNGNLYKADHVIVTVSLGVLKERHQNLFIPSLPEDKVSAIEAIGFGNVAKIYLQYDHPFWEVGDNRILAFSFVYNDDDRLKLQTDPEKEWLLGMYGAMTVESKPKLLTLWVTGKYAKQMEALSEDKVLLHAAENLRRFLKKSYPDMGEPVAMLRSQWFTNLHFRGTYSYRSVETHKRGAFPAALEKPVLPEKMALLFGGEASESERFSTVDGAIRAGWKAAQRLTDFYENKS